jgi:hypothetical protein
MGFVAWDVMLSSLLKVSRRFSGTSRLHSTAKYQQVKKKNESSRRWLEE